MARKVRHAKREKPIRSDNRADFPETLPQRPDRNHLRTTLSGIGQVETDEIYVGIDKHGVHYVFPVQAKGGTDRIGAVQVEQDFAACAEKFPDAIGRPIAAQFMDDETIVLFEFVQTEEGVRVASQKHYRLVQPDELSAKELEDYRKRIS